MQSKSVAIVTGASQGIGRASAIRLARDFEAVVLAARQEDELKKTAATVESAGAESLTYALDLREPRSVEILVQGTFDRLGRIDALLNIAGAVPQIDLFEMTDAQWEDGMALKLHGARRVTIRAWDALKASKGAVVLISGSAALDPKPGFAAVATVNAAIIALAKAFAEQGIKDGVQVNSVVPGPVMTGRRRSFLDRWAPAHGMSVEEAMKQFPEEAGIARYGEPEEIAGLMAYLVSKEARWLTGASVRIDGGEIKGVDGLRLHWPEYLMEAGESGLYLFSACAVATLLWHPASPLQRYLPSDTVRRILMGLAMGTTIIAIVLTPWGKQSGAHFNPAVTLAFHRLGKWPRGIRSTTAPDNSSERSPAWRSPR